MTTELIKDTIIRIRVTKEKKAKFKNFAKKRNKKMSEIIRDYINKELDSEEFNKQHQEVLEKRIIDTDEKLLKLKQKYFNI